MDNKNLGDCMSSSFAKSSFGKSANKASPFRKAFRIAVLGFVLASGWADYQYYTPAETKDHVGAWVEQKTGSELLGEMLGHKAKAVTIGNPDGTHVTVTAPKGPGQ